MSSRKKMHRKKAVDKQTVLRLIANRKETKYFVSSRTGLGVSTASTIDPVSEIPQNDTDTGRNGDTIILKDYEFRYHITGADATNNIRIIVLQWKEQLGAGAAPAEADILQNIGSLATVSSYSHDDAKRWKVLYDRVHATSLNGPNALNRVVKRWKFGSKKIQFEGGTQQGQHKMYILAVSDSGASSHPQLSYTFKLRYYDS